jgi:hypothetical protein
MEPSISTLLIERLTLFKLLYACFHERRYINIRYVSESPVARALSGLPGFRCNGKLKKVGYTDLPGSFFEAQEEVYFFSNDALFEACSRNVYLNLAAAFTGDDSTTLPIQKELLNRYTAGRTNTQVFLTHLMRDGPVHLIPKDSRDMREFISPGRRTGEPPVIPPPWTGLNRVSDPLKAILAPFVLPFACSFIALKLLKRGIAFHPDPPRHYAFGFDLQKYGLKADRGLIGGKFFLYSEGPFHPSRILHVVRSRLEDEEARRSLERLQCAYTEFDRIKIPVRYFFRRILYEFLLLTSLRVFREIFRGQGSPVLLIPSLAAMKMTMEAEIFYQAFDVDVFIARDEYSPFHIARTKVANRYGNRTVGFQWADFWDRGEALSHFVFDAYGIWGEFYTGFLAKTLKYTKRMEIIGGNIYGSDAMFRMAREGYLPGEYRALKEQYTIVAIMATSIAPEISLTREATLTFYRDALAVAHAFGNAFCVLKPKTGELDEELEELTREFPRARIEKDLHTYAFLPLADVVICIGNSTIGLEALMLGKKVVFYDLTGFPGHLYARYSPFLVARTREELQERVARILRDGLYLDDGTLEEIRRRHGYAFDGCIAERFRKLCLGLLPEPPGAG